MMVQLINGVVILKIPIPIVNNLQVKTGNGSVSQPTYTFQNELNTGMYKSALNEIGFTINGSQQAKIDISGSITATKFIGDGSSLSNLPIQDLSGYLTSAIASNTYQTINNMSSYLASTTASNTYQTQSGMSNYLTSTTASNTYQTQSGMSTYLTSATAQV